MDGPGGSGHLTWRTVPVEGRTVAFGHAGDPGGVPVLFLHGWALGSRSYKRALKRLVMLGCQVWAPSLPGLGGSAGLPGNAYDLDHLARWAEGFLDAAGAEWPLVVAGHSFGGAVATQLAHDHPAKVARLVLINAVGSGVWTAGRTSRPMRDRPLWHWAYHFSRDILGDAMVPTVRSILEDAVPNLLSRPRSVWKAGMAARCADLTVELAEIRRRGIPVMAVSSRGDLVIPKASFEALCCALGVRGLVVAGGHSWLLGRPDEFAEMMAPLVEAVTAERERPRLRAVNG